jgi:hypothetical protein
VLWGLSVWFVIALSVSGHDAINLWGLGVSWGHSGDWVNSGGLEVNARPSPYLKVLWWPDYARVGSTWILDIPFWMPLAALGVAAGLLWRTHLIARRRSRAGCPACGYSRSGLAPGAPCPECGKTPAHGA